MHCINVTDMIIRLTIYIPIEKIKALAYFMYELCMFRSVIMHNLCIGSTSLFTWVQKCYSLPPIHNIFYTGFERISMILKYIFMINVMKLKLTVLFLLLRLL